MKLTLMFREYCSLCHQMRDALKPWQARYGFEVEVVEIDDFPELEAQYNEWVPVLLHQNHPICHWHLDEAALQAYLEAADVEYNPPLYR